MALFNTFGVNRWLKFEVLRNSDGGGGGDGGGDGGADLIVVRLIIHPRPHLNRPLLQPLQTNIQAPRMWIQKAVSLGAHIVLTPTKSLHR
jgi:hypothetical protein